jgi:NADH-quinone oxidoreductase subunit N
MAPGATQSPGDLEVGRGALAALVCWLALGFGFLFTLAAWETQHSSESAAEFFACLLLGLAGVMFVSMADDLLVLLLSVELVALTGGMLVFLSNTPFAGEAAFKQVLLGSIATALLLFGIAILYGLTGETRLAAAQDILHAEAAAGPQNASAGFSRLGLAALVLIVAGLGARLAVAPFHFGNADVFHGGSAWTSGWMSVMPRLAAAIALFRLWHETLTPYVPAGEWIGLVLAAATLAVGTLAALRQANLRRLLAYATISHVGFALVGLSAGAWEARHPEAIAGSTTSGLAAAAFFFGAYLLGVTGLCAVCVYLTRRERQLEYIDDLAGLIRSEPLAAGCALVCLLSLAGIPPLPGFWGRLLVISTAFSIPGDTTETAPPGPHAGFLLLGLLAVLSVLLVGAVYMRVLAIMFLEPQAGRQQPGGGRPALAAAFLAAVLVTAGGLWPGPILGAVNRAVRNTAVASESIPGRTVPSAMQKRKPAPAAVDFRSQGLRANPQRPQQLPRGQASPQLEFAAAMRTKHTGQNAGHGRPSQLTGTEFDGRLREGRENGRRQSRERLPRRSPISNRDEHRELSPSKSDLRGGL